MIRLLAEKTHECSCRKDRILRKSPARPDQLTFQTPSKQIGQCRKYRDDYVRKLQEDGVIETPDEEDGAGGLEGEEQE